MKRIVFAISIFLSVFLAVHAQVSKLSPLVRSAMITGGSPAARAKSLTSPAATPSITAFVRTDDIDALRSEGCRIYARWDDICIASIPLDHISRLASMPCVKRIEAGRSCTATNMISAARTHVDEVLRSHPAFASYLPQPSGASPHTPVIGIVDIGFDLTHPTLFTPGMDEYRVRRVWDMLDTSGEGEAVMGDNDTVYVGRQYIGTEAILRKQHSTDGYLATHGTHVIGTAAGTGVPHPSASSVTYQGMCPNADICIVANYTSDNKCIVPADDTYKYTTATDMLAFKYIFDYAESVGKPCVINFSEGSAEDLYESGLYGEVLARMTGPGRILCSAAGNEGSADGTYMHKPRGRETAGAFVARWAAGTAQYAMSSTTPAVMTLAFYRNGTKALSRKYDCSTLSGYPDSIYQDTVTVDGERYAVALHTYPSCFDGEKFATDITLDDLQHDRFGYATPVSLTVEGSNNDIEVFACGGYLISSNLDPSLGDYDCTHNVFFPGCVEDVICVGATSYVESVENMYGYSVGRAYGSGGVRAGYSSIGPTNSGLTKPDVMAPGTNVISAYSRFWRERNPAQQQSTFDVMTTTIDGTDYPWGISTGTSMACPVVTGIIGLWLQVCPTLTPAQIREVFASTCSRNDRSLTYPNNYYGWGEIDAMKGMRYIEQNYTGVQSHATPDREPVICDINGIRRRDTRTPGIYILSDGVTVRKAVR